MSVKKITQTLFSMRKLIVLIPLLACIQLWSQATDPIVPKVFKNTGIERIDLSADNKYLVIQADNYPKELPVKVYNTQKQQLVKANPQVYLPGIEHFALHPSEAIIALLPGEKSGKIKVVDLEQNKVLQQFPQVYSGRVAFSPDGGELAILAYDKIALYNWRNGQETKYLQTEGYAYQVKDLFFHPTAPYLFFTVLNENDKNNKTRFELLVWDLNADQTYHLFATSWNQTIGDFIYLEQNGIFGFTEKSGNYIKSVHLWSNGNFTEKPFRYSIKKDIAVIAISPDGRQLAHFDNELEIIELATGDRRTYEPLDFFLFDAYSLQFTPDSKGLFIGSNELYYFSIEEEKFQELIDPGESFRIRHLHLAQNKPQLYFSASDWSKYASIFQMETEKFSAKVPKPASSFSDQQTLMLPESSPDFIKIATPHQVIVKAPSAPCNPIPQKSLGPMQLINQIHHRISPPYQTELASWAFNDSYDQMITFVSDQEYHTLHDMLLWDLKTRCPILQFELEKNTASDYFSVSTAQEIRFENEQHQVLLNDGLDDFFFNLKSGEIERAKKHEKDYPFLSDLKTGKSKDGKASVEIEAYSNAIQLKGKYEKRLYQYENITDIILFNPVFCLDDRVLAVTYSQTYSDVGTGWIFFDINSGKEIVKIDHSKANILSNQFSNKLNCLISLHQDGTVNFWNIDALLNNASDLQIKKQRMVLQSGHIGNINSVDFSPDGKTLMSVSNDQNILFWDLKTGLHFNPIRTGFNVSDAAFLDGGDKLYVQAGGTQIWNPNNGRLIEDVDAQPYGIYNPLCDVLVTNAQNDYNALQLWSLNPVKKGKKLSLKGEDTSNPSVLAISNDGNTILVLSNSPDDKSRVSLYNTKNGRLTASFSDFSDYVIHGVFSEDSQHIALGQHDGNVTIIPLLTPEKRFSFGTGRFSLKAVPLPSGQIEWKYNIDFNAASLSRVNQLTTYGDWLVSAGEFGNIAIWDFKSGQLIQSLRHYDAPPDWFYKNKSYNPDYNPIVDLKFSPDGKYMASVSKRRSIKLWETARFKLVKTLETQLDFPDKIIYHPTRDILFSTTHNEPTAKLFDINFDDAYLPPDSTIKVWSFENGIQLQTLQLHAFNLSNLVLSDDGKILASADDHRHVLVWDWEKGDTIAHHWFADQQVHQLALSPSGKYLAIVEEPFTQSIKSKEEISVYELPAFKRVFHQKLPNDVKGRVGFLNKNQLAWCDEKKIQAYDLVKKQVRKWENLPDFEPQYFEKIPGSDQVVVSTDFDLLLYSKTGKYLGKQFDGDYMFKITATSGDGAYAAIAEIENAFQAQYQYRITIIDLQTMEAISEIPAHKARIRSLSFHRNNKWLLSSSEDGSIVVWDWEKRQKVTHLVANDNGFIAFQADNHFFSSKDINQIIGFENQENVFGFEQFDLKYNRPDLVLEKLGMAPDTLIKAYHLAYKKRLQKMGIDEAMLSDFSHLPEIEILTKDIPLETTNPVIKFEVKASDNKYLLNQINVFVNNVPIYGSQGMSISKQKSPLEQAIELPLSYGENKIQVSTTNENGLESVRETFHINYIGQPTLSDLYVIAIGVSEFEDPNRNLQYAQKDAEDFMALFDQQNAFYNKIHYLPLLGPKFSPPQINQLKVQLQRASVHDKVIVFYAGHGLISSDFEYYLSTFNTDFDQPANNSVAYTDLELLLEGIPIRNKLLLIDACHSGEIDTSSVAFKQIEAGAYKEGIIFRQGNKGVQPTQVGLQNSFELMRNLFIDLRRGTGASTIASASGVEFAFEGTKWQNGVFSYALFKGLSQLKADLNKDGKVTVVELKKYLISEVPRLTENHQQPTGRLNELANDFVIWYGETPKAPTLPSIVSSNYFEASESIKNALYQIQDFDKALDLASQAMAKWPNQAQLFSYRGTAKSNLGRYNEAIIDYSKAIELAPEDAQFWADRSNAYNSLGDFEKAFQDSGKAIELDPYYTMGYFARSIAYTGLGDYKNAFDCIAKIRKLEPNNQFIDQLEALIKEVQANDK